MQTTLILLDTGNLHYCIKRRYKGHRIDFKKIHDVWCKELVGEVDIVAYGAIPNKGAYTFRDALKHYGFVVKFKELKGGIKYYNPIVDIVLDAINHVDKVSTIIIGSSNQEFLPLINWLKARSIRVGIWASNIGYEIQRATNFYREIDREVLLGTAKTRKSV